MSRTYEVEVTIYDENIPQKWLKKIQKLKSECMKEVWTCGDINHEENRVKYYEHQILQQDIHIYWYSHHTIRIFTGHEIDRDNLKLFEKILGSRARINVDKERIELSFDCSKRNTSELLDYKDFPIFQSRFDISRKCNNYDVEINGYKWRDQDD